MVFYCKIILNELIKGFDVSDIQYFAIENIPELSEDRILKSQVELLHDKVLTGDKDVYVD